MGTLLLSIIIPLITFTTYVEVPAFQTPIHTSEIATPPYVPEYMFKEPINYWPAILWSIYGIGVLIFTIRFSVNLNHIIKRIKQNPKFKKHSIIYVLLNDLVQPHTFLNYIFFNKAKYEANKIPKEVLLHEETHAREKHALDILFIEVLQIIFWFNPLLYFLKKDIKLNHEFLADQAVLNNGFDVKNYQNTLLAFSSNAQESQLVNALNYSSIKKRFTVMKTHTSKTKTLLKSIVLLPLLAILIYSFSKREKIVKETPQILLPQEKKKNKNDLVDSIKKELEKVNALQVTYIDTTAKAKYYQNVTFQISQKDSNTIRNKSYNELTKEEKQQLPPPPKIPNKKSPSNSELTAWQDSKTYGVWLDDRRIKNNSLKTYSPSDFSLYYVSKLEKNAVNYGKHYYQVSLYTHSKYYERYKNGIKPLSKGALIKINSKKKTQSNSWTKVETVLKNASTSKNQNPTIDPINIFISKDNKLKLNNKPVTQHNIIKEVNRLNTFLTPKQKQKYAWASILYEDEGSKPFAKQLIEELRSIDIYSTSLSNTNALNKHNLKPFNVLSNEGKTLKEAEANYNKIMNEGSTKDLESYNDSLKKAGSPWKVDAKFQDISYSETSFSKHRTNEQPTSTKSAYSYVKSLKGKNITYYYNKKQVSFKDILDITKKEPNINISTNIKDNKGTVKFWSVEK
ncbi:M56 family metallopeptidase [Mangrovimonas cancribranchiae]|uniref:M56 family metallopeptidase n=1 Tax=Mangrovimonas cancribranchiae TaxID=3080055 RepID=A0AAU6P3L3_9FLAO